MVYLEEVSREIHQIFPDVTACEIVADACDGLIFTEGPVWDNATESLIFSDIPGNRIYRLYPGHRPEILVNYSFKANGNALFDGVLYTCEHATSRLAQRNLSTGDYEVVCSHYEGLELNSPNDLVVTGQAQTQIWFTDPFFGRNPSRVGVKRRQQLDFQGVYCWCDGELTLIDSGYENPNGLCFDASGKRLFVNDSPGSRIYCLELAGLAVEHRTLWAKTSGAGPGKPDGMKLDSSEYLYVAAEGGIHVFTPAAELIGKLRLPEQVGNFCFGGREGKELYICATDKVYRLPVGRSGLGAR